MAEIDKLTLEILLKENDVVKRINAITKALENLKKVSGDIDKVAEKLNNISPTSTRGGSTSTGGSNKTKDKSWTEKTYQVDKLGKSFLAQSVSVKKFNNETIKTTSYFDEQGKALKTITTQIDAYGNKVQKIQSFQDKQNKKTPKTTGKNNVNIFATLGKWSYMVNMARYYGRSLANIVQLAMDYNETQNLWQVANRNNLEMADEFIQKMNKAYGISEQTLMNYQAIFKNMLSALGDLSDEISSGLSMQLTQMALDFSSLYNVTIPNAMQKFQAVLSGQVRPIRSVSGYDITENTIFDLYAGAGGEKTMRQLSQIEKRLLRIVAVFDQMSATGATGDMAKTIESAANQARIMSEQAKETLTWTGHLILMWMDSIGLLQHINAFLITAKEIIRAIAYDMGYSEKNFLDGLVTSSEAAGEAIDEIQGKLLSFDKFESLNSSDDNVLGIDQTVLDLLKNVNYQTEQFNMEANKIAESWLTSLGFIDENGDGILDITEKARGFLDTLKTIASVFGIILGASMLKKLGAMLTGFKGIKDMLIGINKAVAIYMAFDLITNWGEMSVGMQALKSAILAVTVAIWAMTTAQMSFWAAATWGLAAALIAGVLGAVGSTVNAAKQTSMADVPQYATGGFPEDGLFFANSGEMVGKFSNGRTAVANNDQITTGIAMAVEPAVYRAVKSAMAAGSGGDIVLQLDGRELARANVGNNARALSSNYRIDLQPR